MSNIAVTVCTPTNPSYCTTYTPSTATTTHSVCISTPIGSVCTNTVPPGSNINVTSTIIGAGKIK